MKGPDPRPCVTRPITRPFGIEQFGGPEASKATRSPFSAAHLAILDSTIAPIPGDVAVLAEDGRTSAGDAERLG